MPRWIHQVSKKRLLKHLFRFDGDCFELRNTGDTENPGRDFMCLDSGDTYSTSEGQEMHSGQQDRFDWDL